jgi:hypothetical protein
MNGYSVNWNKKKQTNEGENNKAAKNTADALVGNESSEVDEYLTAAAEERLPLLPAKVSMYITPESQIRDSCDVIKLKSQEEISAKVLEINTATIRYKKCNNLSGPDYIVSKADVKEITYSNGTKESAESFRVVKETKEAPKVIIKEEVMPIFARAKEDHISAKLCWHFGILGFVPVIGWIFALMAIIHGLIGLYNTSKKPELYTGKQQAVVGICLGIAALIAGILVVMLIFSSLLL